MQCYAHWFLLFPECLRLSIWFWFDFFLLELISEKRSYTTIVPDLHCERMSECVFIFFLALTIDDGQMNIDCNHQMWMRLIRSIVHLFTRLVFIPTGILQKMKEGAENVERKIQAKVESLKNVNDSDKGMWNSIAGQSKHCLFTCIKVVFIVELKPIL